MEKNYPTSKIVTAIVLKLMWESCRANRLAMAAFKGKYTEEFIDARIAEIVAAQMMPSQEAVALIHSRLHNDALVLAKAGRRNWQSLKLYITEYAVNAELNVDDELNAAGWADYEKASNDSFASLEDLLLNGSQYIADHSEALTADDNMPEGFPEIYNTKMAEVEAKVAAFHAAVEAAPLATAAKVEAFNNCYAAGISMGIDGQHVMADNEELKKQFSFEAVMGVVTPPGAPELDVQVKLNGELKQGAEVSIVGTDKRGTTDTNGETLLTQLSSGAVVCKIVCDGCADKFVNVTLSPGVTSRIHVTLEPLFDGEMTVGSEHAEESAEPAVSSHQ
jgi:hypothetical protein